VSIDDLRLKRLNGQAMAELGSWSPTPVDGLPTQPSPAVLESDPAEIARLRAELTAEVVRVVHPSSGEDLNRVILIVLEGILRGGPFNRVIFCMMTPDRTALKARYGLGDQADQVLERFSFELSPREGPIPVAMLRRQSIYVPVERDFTAQELRFAQSLGSSSFGVFPVVVGGRLLGCVFCDRPWNSKLPDKATLAYVRSLCDGAVRGIEARVSGTMATVAARASSGGQAALGATVARVPSGVQQVVRATPAYSAAHKSEMILRLLRTNDAEGIARECGVSEEKLEQWKKEFLAGAIAGLRNG
ncbi:MAG: helix-turn-helix domain-containing protein, partial [Gemmatimonadaceae bacterium]